MADQPPAIHHAVGRRALLTAVCTGALLTAVCTGALLLGLVALQLGTDRALSGACATDSTAPPGAPPPLAPAPVAPAPAPLGAVARA